MIVESTYEYVSLMYDLLPDVPVTFTLLLLPSSANNRVPREGLFRPLIWTCPLIGELHQLYTTHAGLGHSYPAHSRITGKGDMKSIDVAR